MLEWNNDDEDQWWHKGLSLLHDLVTSWGRVQGFKPGYCVSHRSQQVIWCKSIGKPV